MPDPEAGEAVGLELDAHQPTLRTRAVAGLVRVPSEILDVVAVLVGEDVCLGERTAPRSELRCHLVEEAEVDVDVLVVRAVERADRRGRRAAASLDAVREEARLRRLVVPHRLRPVDLHAVDDGEDAAVLTRVRVGARLAVLREAPRLSAWPDRLALEGAEIAEAAAAREEDEGEDDDDADDPAAAPERDRKAARDSPPRPR